MPSTIIASELARALVDVQASRETWAIEAMRLDAEVERLTTELDRARAEIQRLTQTAPVPEVFTDAEQAVVDAHRGRVQGIPECVDHTSAADLQQHEHDHGRDDTITYAKNLFRMLDDWHTALDSAHADLVAVDDTNLSPAAEFFIHAEANRFMHALNLVRREVLRYLLGTAGPAPAVDSGALCLSNFPVIPLNGTAVAEG